MKNSVFGFWTSVCDRKLAGTVWSIVGVAAVHCLGCSSFASQSARIKEQQYNCKKPTILAALRAEFARQVPNTDLAPEGSETMRSKWQRWQANPKAACAGWTPKDVDQRNMVAVDCDWAQQDAVYRVEMRVLESASGFRVEPSIVVDGVEPDDDEYLFWRQELLNRLRVGVDDSLARCRVESRP